MFANCYTGLSVDRISWRQRCIRSSVKKLTSVNAFWR